MYGKNAMSLFVYDYYYFFFKNCSSFSSSSKFSKFSCLHHAVRSILMMVIRVWSEYISTIRFFPMSSLSFLNSLIDNSNNYNKKQPSLYLSKYIILNKDDYYFNLSGVTQRNDWKSWVMYMLNAVEYTSNHTNTMVNEIIEQMEATLAYGKEKIKWYNKDVNEAIFSQPYIKAGLIGQVIGKSSRTTITKYMGELVKHKILNPQKEGKEIYYLNNDLIRILEA